MRLIELQLEEIERQSFCIGFEGEQNHTGIVCFLRPRPVPADFCGRSGGHQDVYRIIPCHAFPDGDRQPAGTADGLAAAGRPDARGIREYDSPGGNAGV